MGTYIFIVECQKKKGQAVE
nr:unnamed protein product [Callosobruchus chinensis]